MLYLKATSVYYRRKAVIHNWTSYDLVSFDTLNIMRDETEGQLNASEFPTCVVKRLDDLRGTYPNAKTILLGSDDCSYQNQNTVMSNALIN